MQRRDAELAREVRAVLLQIGNRDTACLAATDRGLERGQRIVAGRAAERGPGAADELRGRVARQAL